MNKLITKIAAGLAAKLKKLRKLDRVYIDNDVWKKTTKKAEIVDLWHQVNKGHFSERNNYDRHFDFINAEKRGVDFYIYGSHPAFGKVIRDKLDELGVKYETDEDE